MNIDNKIVEELTTLKSDVAFKCDSFGLVNSKSPNTLSFIDDEKFLEQLILNKNISVVFSTPELKDKIIDRILIVSDDPRFYFYDFVNKFGIKNYVSFPSEISSSAKINPKAYVSENNVIIGDNTVISANVSILADVEIGSNCFIQAGAVIGSQGYEYKRTSKGILSVYHDGKVIIGNNVEIGANTCIDKGFFAKNTVVEDDVKIDNLVHVAHSVLIKRGAFVIACSMLAGSCIVGEGAWVGPNATVGHVVLGNQSNVTFGSVVTKNVGNGEKVSGNFAIPHDIFLNFIKKLIKQGI